MKQDLNGVRTPEDVVRRYDLGDIPLIVKSQKEITLEVSKKVGDDEIISKINLTPEQTTINADKISLEGKNIDLTGQNIAITSDNFSVDTEGNMTCNDATMNNANINEGEINITAPNDSVINIGAFEGISVTDNSLAPSYVESAIYSASSINFYADAGGFPTAYYNNGGMGYVDTNDITTSTIEMDGSTGSITCVTLTQTSLEEKKKNFEKLEHALDIVKDTDIYKYNFNYEADDDKKHIGFVIGDNFKYRREITSKKNDSAELYSMISVLWKAVQEQQEEIERLKVGKK